MRIYLIRHGESIDDLENAYGGIADFPLTDNGREQARTLAERLREEGLDALFTSPLRRASDTAHTVADIVDVPGGVCVEYDLHERNTYGYLSGVNRERASEIFAHLIERQTSDGFPGSESHDELVARIRRVLAHVIKTAESHQWSRIGILTHGKFMRALWTEVLELPGEPESDFVSVNPIDYQPSKAAVFGSDAP